MTKLIRENLRTRFKGLVHWLSTDEPGSARLLGAAGDQSSDGFLVAAFVDRFYGSGSI
jgi:hypothetical protein